MGIRSPFMRSIGGTPTARCTSEQPCCMPSFRNASMRATVGRILECYVLTQACDGEGASSVTQCAILFDPDRDVGGLWGHSSFPIKRGRACGRHVPFCPLRGGNEECP